MINIISYFDSDVSFNSIRPLTLSQAQLHLSFFRLQMSNYIWILSKCDSPLSVQTVQGCPDPEKKRKLLLTAYTNTSIKCWWLQLKFFDVFQSRWQQRKFLVIALRNACVVQRKQFISTFQFKCSTITISLNSSMPVAKKNCYVPSFN